MLLSFIKQSWLVIVSALAFGLLVAAVQGALEGRIAANARHKLEQQLQVLMPDAAVFAPMTGSDRSGRKVTYHVGKDQAGRVVGYALEASGSGFADKLLLLIGFTADLQTLRGVAVLKSNETPGFGDKIKNASKNGRISFKDQFRGCPVTQKLVVVKSGDRARADDKIVAISGATISSEAVTKIVNQAVRTMQSVLQRP